MIEWSLDAFRGCESVRSIVVAAPPGHMGELEQVGREGGGGGAGLGAGAGDVLDVVPGGATRAQSVANALAGVQTPIVAIHDAARPLLTPELVEALVADLEANPEAAGAIAAIPVADTLKRAAEARRRGSKPAFPLAPKGNAGLAIEATVDREGLWAAQTPQVFRTQALREALAVEPEVHAGATDEAMLVEQAGGTVLLHLSEAPNLKVTTAADLRLAELLLEDLSR